MFLFCASLANFVARPIDNIQNCHNPLDNVLTGIYRSTLTVACGMPLFAKGQQVYSFLDTVRLLELLLKNVFVPINDLRETLPQFYAPNNALFLMRSICII